MLSLFSLFNGFRKSCITKVNCFNVHHLKTFNILKHYKIKYKFNYEVYGISTLQGRPLQYSSRYGFVDWNEDEKRKELKLWLETHESKGNYVPEDLTESHMQHLLNANSVSQRRKFLLYLLRKQKLAKMSKIWRENAKEKQKLKLEGQLNNLSHIKYGLWKNSLFAKTFQSSIMSLYHHRLASAMIHGQPLILDLGFEKHMNLIESQILSREVLSCIYLNRISKVPFNLNVCNANFQSRTLRLIHEKLPQSIPMVISSKSYLDLYPKGKFIYLSPDAEYEMSTIDSEAIYIIGGIVDHAMKYQLTLEKAKKEGINTQKLPIDRYINSFKSNYVLDVYDVMAILLNFQETEDWSETMENLRRSSVKFRKAFRPQPKLRPSPETTSEAKHSGENGIAMAESERVGGR